MMMRKKNKTLYMLKKIKIFIFGERAKPIPFKKGVRTLYPKERPTLDEWIEQYKVSMLFEKRVIYMD